MTIQELIDSGYVRLINDGGNGDTEISEVFCCDLLSHAMGSAPEDGIWVTVMNNINTLAVAALTDCGAVVIACGMPIEEDFLEKAKALEITVLASDEQIFETALKIYNMNK